MAEGTADTKDQEEEKPKVAEQRIMCFVSKQMVPMGDTVEVEYSPGKKVRVLPQYVKFDLSAVG